LTSSARFPFDRTQSVAFELSNLCNLAQVHVKCPLSISHASEMLPIGLVHDALQVLADHDWAGPVYLNQYNEPLIDPRLFLFLQAIRDLLPRAYVEIDTNGSFLTVSLAKELAEAGVTKLHVTLYGTPREREAMAVWLEREVDPIVRAIPGWHALDDRLSIYSRPEGTTHESCEAPLGNLTVTCRGDVGLCCFDWARTVTFGSLRELTLAQVCASSSVQDTYRELHEGARYRDVCKRCGTHRG
jgi:hypothetical protein